MDSGLGPAMVMSWQGVATTRHGRTKEAQVHNSAGLGLENRLGDGDELGSVDEIGTGLGDGQRVLAKEPNKSAPIPVRSQSVWMLARR